MTVCIGNGVTVDSAIATAWITVKPLLRRRYQDMRWRLPDSAENNSKRYRLNRKKATVFHKQEMLVSMKPLVSEPSLALVNKEMLGVLRA